MSERPVLPNVEFLRHALFSKMEEATTLGQSMIDYAQDITDLNFLAAWKDELEARMKINEVMNILMDTLQTALMAAATLSEELREKDK